MSSAGAIVEVFKTNVQEQNESEMLLAILVKTFPQFKINFDLEDCDRILRVAGHQICAEKIIGILNANGFYCHVLE